MAAARHFVPRLMPAPAAAHYLGISTTKLRTLPIPRRIMDGNRLYHVTDLDDYADALPMENESEGEDWDDVFRAGASA